MSSTKQDSVAQKYKLTYFNGRGRGEVSRYLFAIANVKYEDNRIEFKDWPALKPNTLLGTLPELVVDGKITIGQSLAIARLLAREFKLYGVSPTSDAQVDTFLDTTNDFFVKGAAAVTESDETKKKEKVATFQAETVPVALKTLEKLAKTYGTTGFAVGKTLSVADVFFYATMETVQCLDALDKFTKLAAIKKTVGTHPAISTWISSRPVTKL